jgi:U2-associated protein SR140
MPLGEIRVVPPTDPEKLQLIHKLAQYVAKEGQHFEVTLLSSLPLNLPCHYHQLTLALHPISKTQQLIVEREKGNAKFQFLIQTDSPDHIYYRWRMFSLVHGDTMEIWRLEPFQVRQHTNSLIRAALVLVW